MSQRKKTANPRPIAELERLSFRLRKEILEMIWKAGSGHPGGSFSCIDVLISLYFGGILNYAPSSPNWKKRDRFILSNGHVCPALYAVLAEAGFFSKKKLPTLRGISSCLQGHPEKNNPSGIETASGFLGQGLSLGVGLALGAYWGKKPAFHVYVLTSDAEHQEGQTWEAVMAASKFELKNLVAIVDRNQIQIDGKTEEIMPMGSLVLKYRDFGWRVLETDGHDFHRLMTTLHQAKEDDPSWHGKAPNDEQYHKAVVELEDAAEEAGFEI